MALLEGVVSKPKAGVINLPLRLDIDNRPFQLVCYEFGKAAITAYEVIAIEDNRTRISFKPLTGRTHQLRVHSAHALGLNCPIVGDDLYGKKVSDCVYMRLSYPLFILLKITSYF